MSLHHIGDETDALRRLRARLVPGGLLAVAEVAEPTRVLPDDLGVGRPGFSDRLDRAELDWLAGMRADLDDSVPSTDLESMLAAAGFDVVGSHVTRERIDPPLSERARQFVSTRIRRARHQFDGRLSDDDLRTLDVLGDPEHPLGVMRRADVFVAGSRRIVVARPREHP
jgi:hypothetical protein